MFRRDFIKGGAIATGSFALLSKDKKGEESKEKKEEKNQKGKNSVFEIIEVGDEKIISSSIGNIEVYCSSNPCMASIISRLFYIITPPHYVTVKIVNNCSAHFNPSFVDFLDEIQNCTNINRFWKSSENMKDCYNIALIRKKSGKIIVFSTMKQTHAHSRLLF